MEDGSPLSRHPRHLQQTFPHPSRWRTPEMCERALWPSQQVPAHFSLAIAWMASTSSLLGGQSGPAGGPRRKSTPNSWPRAHRNQSFSMPSRIRSDRRTMPPSAHVRQVAAAALGPPAMCPPCGLCTRCTHGVSQHQPPSRSSFTGALHAGPSVRMRYSPSLCSRSKPPQAYPSTEHGQVRPSGGGRKPAVARLVQDV